MDEKDLKQIGEVFDERLEKALPNAFEKALPKFFNEAFTQIWEHNLAPAFDALNDRIDKLEARIAKVEEQMAALSSKVTNYLELSDKRYLELKRKNLILAKWIQAIAEKTGTKIDLKELEEISS